MSDLPLRCLVDVDGVIAQWIPKFRGFVMKSGVANEDLPDPQMYDFAKLWGLSSEIFDEQVFDFGEAGGWGRLDPYVDGIEMVTGLLGLGCWVGLATMRPHSPRVVADTLGWVAKCGLGVHSVGIGSASKFEVDVDLVFDDSPEIVRALEWGGECVPLLIDRPWNRGEDLSRIAVDDVVAMLEAVSEMVDLSDLHPSGRQETLRDALVEIGLLEF